MGTNLTIAQTQTLLGFFEAQVARVPTALAVEDPERAERLTYAELDRRVTRLAHQLRALGVGRDHTVALHLHRGSLIYTSMLATLRAGGAYVPIDEGFPEERARFIVEDAAARVVIASRELASRFQGLGVQVLVAEEVEEALARRTAEPMSNDFAAPAAEDLCYVIYTSGTTGQPKGVCLSHGNASTFVRALLDVYGVREDDRVLQGFSTAFDASVEEIWMALATGATLVVGSLEMMRAIDELPARLRDLGITVFSTVPTLLSVVEPAKLDQIRILIAGGEALRQDVVERWARPNRPILNGYGPTETSVVATYTWCHAGDPVTIGKALPGYLAVVLGEDGREVARGQEGELCIGGPAVSLRGYLNRPELNAQKFFDRGGVRFYRTGDLVSEDDKGDLLYLGRIDAQVKVRGFRVELEEIETHLTRALKTLPNESAFQGAIVALRTDPDAPAELVAYILSREPAPLDIVSLVQALRAKVPAYMVPSHFVRMAPTDVPRLSSGKVNRRALPHLAKCDVLAHSAAANDTPADIDVDTPEEELRILRIWRTALNNPALGRDDSFFDFGGNSILAGQSISQFRASAELGLITIRDMYERPTARQLAERVVERANDRAKSHREAHARDQGHGAVVVRLPHRATRRQHLLVGAAQGLTILSTFAFAAWMTYFFLTFLLTALVSWSWWYLAFMMIGLPLAGIVIPIGLGVLAHTTLGGFEEGDHPLWSWGHYRWWLRRFLLAPAHGIAGSFVGTPFAAWAYRHLGARLGKGVFLSSPLEEPSLVTIEDGASISPEVHLRTHAVEGGILRLRRVHIGKNCFVGAQSILGGGSRMEDGAKLHPLSCLAENHVATAHSEWRGSPAERVVGETALGRILAQHERDARPEHGWGTLRGSWKAYWYQSLYAYLFGLVGLAPSSLQIAVLVMGGILVADPSQVSLGTLIALAIPFSAWRAFSSLFVMAAGKRLVLGRATPGTIPLTSKDFAKRWLTNRMMAYLVDPKGLRGFTETLFMPWVLRLFGMKVGKGTEVSDTAGWQPDLVTLGDGVMLADRCVIGVPVVHLGLVTYGENKIEDRAFIANAAHVPITTPVVRTGSLVGVLSIPPDEPAAGTDWLGSPPMRLPNRQRWVGPDALTFNPPRHLVAARWFMNVWKIVLPGAISEVWFWCVMKAALLAVVTLQGWALAFTLFGIGVVYHLVQLMTPVALKWLLVGRYPKGERYLWTFWMWRIELVYEVELMEMSMYSGMLQGTPMLPWWYRAMGAKIGKQVYLSGSIMEADLVTLGDHSTVEGFLQTHLFEDRVMKLGRVDIGEGCSIGSEAGVLYDSTLQRHSALGDLSLIMKGETFLEGLRYRGLPAENVLEHQQAVFVSSGGSGELATERLPLPQQEVARPALVARVQTAPQTT